MRRVDGPGVGYRALHSLSFLEEVLEIGMDVRNYRIGHFLKKW